MFSDPTVMKAINVCHNAHRGQIDRDGRPHHEHCCRVAEKMPTPRLAVIALLHDTIEDTSVTYLDICQQFEPIIADAVMALSRRTCESWNDYIKRVCRNKLAVEVKIADIQDNLARADKKMESRRTMYERALTTLTAARRF